jgi:hypothetical protein
VVDSNIREAQDAIEIEMEVEKHEAHSVLSVLLSSKRKLSTRLSSLSDRSVTSGDRIRLEELEEERDEQNIRQAKQEVEILRHHLF